MKKTALHLYAKAEFVNVSQQLICNKEDSLQEPGLFRKLTFILYL